MLSKLVRKRAGPTGAEAGPVALDEVTGLDPVPTNGDADDRLVALFKNRAELKKAFSELRSECDHLRERLAAIEADPAQSNQRLAALEQRLSERETAYPALVYFQLRGLWRFCHNQLIEFSEQLQEQHLGRERDDRAQGFRAQQQQSLAVFDERLARIGEEYARERQTILDQQARLKALKGFWNHFKRRGVRDELSHQEAVVTEIRGRVDQLRQERKAQLDQQPPDFSGLSVEARRKINLAVLAFAQYLFVEFSENSLAAFSRKAMSASVTEVAYGSQRDCEALMEIIERSMQQMANKRGYADELKLRARHLKLKAQFQGDQATVPTVESMATFPLEFHQGQAGVQVDVNILADDYWSASEALIT
ncbi:MAG: hypothetical protein AAGA68_05630 [Pseudomonadota bacterium]